MPADDRLRMKLIRKIPLIGPYIDEREQIRAERDRLNEELSFLELGWPPGHFYSPLPSIQQVKERENEIFHTIPKAILGLDLNILEQIELFHQFKKYYDDLPFKLRKQVGYRYYYENPNFTFGEAIILYCIMRQIQPKRIIEVGCGFSSCAILDINELEFANTIQCTFIEPYPQLLYELIFEKDRDRIDVKEFPVQEVSVEWFTHLDAGDILFIDSSHVTKVGSDVNHIFFNLLPNLKPGVYIHFHDIMYPFEYPKEWIYAGKAWNEAYLLRAFLQYNQEFKIIFFNSYFASTQRDLIEREMPLLIKNPGTSIWLQKQ